MILSVSGWREWRKRCNPTFVIYHLLRYEGLYGSSLHVRVGDADGVDDITYHWLTERERQGSGITYQVYRADWHGRMLRGQSSSDLRRHILADTLLAFPEPGVKMRSPGSGTAGCLIEAHSLGISVDIPGYRGIKKERGEEQWP